MLSHSHKVSPLLVAKLECARRGKQDDVNHGSLSEARGLSLFLVIRGGIACEWVTRCRSTFYRADLID